MQLKYISLQAFHLLASTTKCVVDIYKAYRNLTSLENVIINVSRFMESLTKYSILHPRISIFPLEHVGNGRCSRLKNRQKKGTPSTSGQTSVTSWLTQSK